jgi:hypothetical protein
LTLSNTASFSIQPALLHKFRDSTLTDLKNRGARDIFIACIDNLQGFAEAVESIFPRTEVQLCIIHQIPGSKKYIAWKDVKAFMQDLKQVYRAPRTKEMAEANLDKLEARWGAKYPAAGRLVATELGPPVGLLCLRPGDPAGHLHDQHHRRLPPRPTEGNQDEGRLCLGRGAHEAALPGPGGDHEQVEAPDPQLKSKIHEVNQTLSQLSIIFGDRLRLDL